ncbi:MAG: DUF1257 domain-containing protein [Moorellales bacterium]
MSHFTAVQAEIRDLEAAYLAALRCGAVEVLANAPCRWFYGQEQKEIVIRLPGKYDAALERQADGTWRLTADWYRGHVARHLGAEGSRFLQLYAVEKAKLEAKRRGFSVVEEQVGEDVVVRISDPVGGALRVWCSPGGQAVCQPEGIKGEACMKFVDLEQALGAVKEHRLTPDYYDGGGPQVYAGHYLCG